MRRVTLLDLAAQQFPGVSREELYAHIACGELRSALGRHRDPKEIVPDSTRLSIEQARFVSRAGYKLEAALDLWILPVEGRVWLDAGASTGGFTDCLLQRGARAVHAVDVGYNQLAYSLRIDPRVHVHERTNVRDVRSLDPKPAAAVIDLSFRSLRGVVGAVLSLTLERWGIALLKPQFELAHEIERGRPGETDGVVRDARLVRDLLENVTRALRDEGVHVRATLDSPLPGRSGNREVLLLVDSGETLPYALNVSRESGAPI